MKTFASPEEFLAHIRAVEASALPRSHHRDEMFRQIHEEQLKVSNETHPPGSELFDHIVADRMAEIERTLRDDQRVFVRKAIAAGSLEHATVNAQILRNSDRHYAIVVNHDLIVLLNKFIKLVAAAKDPTTVIYCNRGNPGTFSGAAYVKMADEILAHYAQTGIPLRPRIKFDLNSQSYRFSVSALRSVELFILAHEVGHFINGDLEAEQSFVRWNLDGDVLVFIGSRRHRCEFCADRFAFETSLRIEKTCSLEGTAADVLFGFATLTFNFLRGISDRESYSHPSPSSRLLTIVGDFFGDDIAKLIEQSFGNPALVTEVRNRIGNVSIEKLLADAKQ